ncbi:MAG: nucleotidyltransferase domain-containing protein [Pirellulales bacterium]|nr:nucleotidyltransferase domain-containing protein [Pirellulales bacterium]
MVAQYPPSIKRLIELGIERVAPRRIILFGSRARGDAQSASDYDLAFDFPASQRKKWLRFLAEVSDGAVTLLSTDIIAWADASAELRKSIRTEGIVVYEQAYDIQKLRQGPG